jgi:hypothetical protein
VFLVTVGRDVRGPAAIVAKVNDVIKLVAGEDATFTDPELAGRRLGALLDAGPRTLLVLDDVWDAEQLAPFAEGGRVWRSWGSSPETSADLGPKLAKLNGTLLDAIAADLPTAGPLAEGSPASAPIGVAWWELATST